MAQQTLNNAPADEICTDKEVLQAKQTMMKKMKWSSVLSSISRVATFIGGPLLAGGLGVGLTSVITSMSAAGGGLALGAAIGAMAAPVVGTLVAGAAFVALAVGADYAASRMWQAGQFDNLEVNAKSTAHHLVQEMKSNNLCLEHEQNCRSDGKKWANVVRPERPAQQPTVQV